MEPGILACIDMEFGHVYGTRPTLTMPVEIGAVLYASGEDRVEYTGICMEYDLDVEIWQNMVDGRGVKVGVSASVANPGRDEAGKPYDPRFRLAREEWRDAKREMQQAYAASGRFISSMLDRYRVSTLLFFADRMERKTFHRAQIPIRKYTTRDIQREIKASLGMDHLLSLDRAATIIGFATDGTSIASHNFRYTVPDPFRDQILPHRAVGDAARMFLLFREFSDFPENFEDMTRGHLRDCSQSTDVDGADPSGPA
jgi:hypothetical protein